MKPLINHKVGASRQGTGRLLVQFHHAVHTGKEGAQKAAFVAIG
jgi:hypothetical protein